MLSTQTRSVNTLLNKASIRGLIYTVHDSSLCRKQSCRMGWIYPTWFWPLTIAVFLLEIVFALKLWGISRWLLRAFLALLITQCGALLLIIIGNQVLPPVPVSSDFQGLPPLGFFEPMIIVISGVATVLALLALLPIGIFLLWKNGKSNDAERRDRTVPPAS